MINFFHYKIDQKYFKYLLILGWISIWASLSFDPSKIDLLLKNISLEYIRKFSLFEFLDLCRGLFQLFYLVVLSIALFLLVKSKKIFFKSNIIFYLFLMILLIETFSLFKSDNPNINIFFIICSLNTLLTVFLLKNFCSESDLILIFKISVIILTLLLIFYGGQYLSYYFETGTSIYKSWGNIIKIVNYDVPKPTGLSRTALIVFIFLSNIDLLKKPFNKINFSIMTLSIVLIFLLSSRTIILLYFLCILFYIFYFKIYKIKNLFLFFGKFILVPIVVIILLIFTQNFYHSNKGKALDLGVKDITRDYPPLFKDTYGFNERTSDSSRKFSSGRLTDWKYILSFNNNIYLGNGVLGDRYLIKQSASNMLLYTYSSSGIIGLLILIYISIIVLIRAFKNTFVNKTKFYPYKFITSLIVVMLMLRSILETSYGVFGIDFILFCICFSLIVPNTKYHESN